MKKYILILGLISVTAFGAAVNEIKGKLNAAGLPISNVGTPVSPTDAASQGYVSANSLGINGGQSINNSSSSQIGLTVKGASSQTADLFNANNFNGTSLHRIKSDGQLDLGGNDNAVANGWDTTIGTSNIHCPGNGNCSFNIVTDNSQFSIWTNSSTDGVPGVYMGAGKDTPLYIDAKNSDVITINDQGTHIYFSPQTDTLSDLFRFRGNDGTAMIVDANRTLNLYGSLAFQNNPGNIDVNQGQFNNLNAVSISPSNNVTLLVLKGSNGQTNDLLQLKNYNGTIISKIDSEGRTFSRELKPINNDDATFDVGSSSARWATGYFDGLRSNTLITYPAGDTTFTLQMTGTSTTSPDGASLPSLFNQKNTGAANVGLNIFTSTNNHQDGTGTGSIHINTGDVIPTSGGTSGSIYLETGSSDGTVGTINLNSSTIVKGDGSFGDMLQLISSTGTVYTRYRSDGAIEHAIGNGNDLGLSVIAAPGGNNVDLMEFLTSTGTVLSAISKDGLWNGFNEASAEVSITGVVSAEDLNGLPQSWIAGNCSLASSIFTCSLDSVFASTPKCHATIHGSSSGEISQNPTAANSVDVYTFDSTGAASDRAFTITCRGAQ